MTKRSITKPLSPKTLVQKKYPTAALIRGSVGYEIRSCGSPQLRRFGWGATPRAAWADAAKYERNE